MSQSRVYRTEGIVLRHMELGEADRIVTFITPFLGKVRAVARGVRRSRSQLGGHLDLLVRGNYLIAHGKSLDVVSQAQTLDGFLPLRNDLELAAQAFYLAELADHFFVEAMEDYPLYVAFVDALDTISAGNAGVLLLPHFELKALLNAGFGPELHQCIGCSEQLLPTVNFFTSQGGILCPKCRNQDLQARPFSLNALKVLRFMEGKTFSEVQGLKVEEPLLGELRGLLKQCLWYHLEAQVKSSRFLEHVYSDQAVVGSIE